MSLAYSHDPAGRITRKQGNNDDWRYQYDPAERLIQATGLAESHDYQYDELGNRLDIGGQYDPANRIQQDATYDYTFDERGNLIAKVDKTTGERHEYTYNADNRLVRFERYPAGSGTQETTATYAYDPFGRRIEKTIDGVTTLFQWSGSSLIAEYDQNGSVTRRYHYATGYAPAQVEDGNGSYQVHTDHLDAPWYLTDSSGTVVWKAAYAPYGSAVVDEDPDGDGTAVTFNIRFPGQYFDQETGLHYNYFRDYDPSTGRYVESDPIGLKGGLNTYTYGLGNPVRWTDSLGLDVYVCGRPADLPFPMGMFYHEWLLTDTVEAGMGPAGGGIPAQGGNSDWPGAEVEVTDHTGESTADNAHCDHVEKVDEDCVNRLLTIGRQLGRWSPGNQCQSFVMDVLIQCDKK